MRQNKVIQSLLLNWPAKVFSLVLAILVYVFVQYASLDIRVVTIPLEVSLPAEGVAPQSKVPSEIEVEIKGKDSLIHLVNPSAIEASVDFSTVRGEGISVRNVVLEYERHLFDTSHITFVANPVQIRIFFMSEKGL